MMHRRAHNIRINAFLHLIKEHSSVSFANLCLFSFLLLTHSHTHTHSRNFTHANQFAPLKRCIYDRYRFEEKLANLVKLPEYPSGTEKSNNRKKNFGKIVYLFCLDEKNNDTISSLASTTENVRLAKSPREITLHFLTHWQCVSPQ